MNAIAGFLIMIGLFELGSDIKIAAALINRTPSCEIQGTAK